MLHALGTLHTLGQPIAWCAVTPGVRRFLRLPSYPWQRERFWHESEESRLTRLAAPSHPLLGAAQGGPRPAWESRLDLRLAPYLADHRVQHAAILPAAAYVEQNRVGIPASLRISMPRPHRYPDHLRPAIRPLSRPCA